MHILLTESWTQYIRNHMEGILFVGLVLILAIADRNLHE